MFFNKQFLYVILSSLLVVCATACIIFLGFWFSLTKISADLHPILPLFWHMVTWILFSVSYHYSGHWLTPYMILIGMDFAILGNIFAIKNLLLFLGLFFISFLYWIGVVAKRCSALQDKGADILVTYIMYFISCIVSVLLCGLMHLAVL